MSDGIGSSATIFSVVFVATVVSYLYIYFSRRGGD